MKRYEMIKDKRRFNFIIKSGHYNKDRNFVVYYVPREHPVYSHYGIAIKKTIGHAVIRNRLKRQVRSIIDQNKLLFKKDYDYIIMIRNECLNKVYEEMNNSLVNLLKGIK